jgi:hypothetical protein
MAKDIKGNRTNAPPPRRPDFTSRRDWATADEAFARIKNQLGDPDLSALRLFQDMHARRLGFGGMFPRLGPNPSTENFSAVLAPRFLEKYKFKGFLISDDGMRVQLWPMPHLWSTTHRIFLFIKRADLDRHYPTDAPVTNVRVVDVADTLINRLSEALSKAFEWLREVLPSRPRKAPDLPKPDKAWLDANYARLKTEDLIRRGMKPTAVAKALVRAMEADPTVSTLEVRSFARTMEARGYCPVKADKK